MTSPPTPTVNDALERISRTRVWRALESPQTLLIVVAFAAVLRVLYFITLQGDAYANDLTLDHRAYHDWALRIANGTDAPTSPFFVDPLYAYFLAALYRVFGDSVVLVRVVQHTLGVATVGLTGILGTRVFRSPVMGSLAALLYALFIPALHYEAQLEKAALATFLCTAAIAAYVGTRRRDLVLAGLACGLAVLTRGNVLVLLAAGVVGLLVSPGPTSADDGDGSAPSFSEHLLRAALFAVPALVLVSLATIHNWNASHELVLTTSNFGQNLYIGQHRENFTGTYRAPDFLRPDPQFEEADFRAQALERSEKTEMTAREVSAFWTDEALGAVKRFPAATLSLTLRKLLLVFHRWEVPDNASFDYDAERSALLRLPVVRTAELAVLALLGAVVWFRRAPHTRVVAAATVVYVAGLLIFFVLGRFRLPMIPLLSVLAAGGAVWLWSVFADGRVERAIPISLALLTAYTFFVVEPSWLATLRTQSLAVTYNNVGAMRLERHDERGAIAAFERAIAIDDRTAISALRSLGDLYLAKHDFARAEKMMRRVLALKPDSARGREALARLERARSAPAAAGAPPTQGDTNRARQLMAESRAARQAGRWDEAIAKLKEAIASGPYDENARYSLGSLMHEHGSADDMIAYYAAEADRDPKPQTSYYFWALALERKGDLDGAIGKLERALQIDPAHEMSEERLSEVLLRRGDVDGALEHCQRASEIHPDFRAAYEQCARVYDRMNRPQDAAAARAQAAAANPNTTKRFLYWGRYLVRVGRFAAAIPELEHALEANPSDSEATRLLATARERAGVLGGQLSPDARAAFASAIAGGRGSPVWLAHAEHDRQAAELAGELARIFRDAGWDVRGTSTVPFPIRAGTFLFAADLAPPGYVDIVNRALSAAGLSPSLATDYRSYYEEMTRTRPEWRGFSLAQDQSFVLVIGRRAPAQPTAP